VVAATNRDLELAVADGRFREDLYYRLSVFPIDVPPLRERGDDVVQIASHFLERTCQEFGHPPLTLSKQQAALLKHYDWPGNIRELKNVIERAVILSRGKVLRLDLAMSDILNAPAAHDDATGTDPSQHGRGRIARLGRRGIERVDACCVSQVRTAAAARRETDDARAGVRSSRSRSLVAAREVAIRAFAQRSGIASSCELWYRSAP
jgi:transcriptional regulator with GAF, ATPase, and Fis domain